MFLNGSACGVSVGLKRVSFGTVWEKWLLSLAQFGKCLQDNLKGKDYTAAHLVKQERKKKLRSDRAGMLPEMSIWSGEAIR